MLGFPFTSWSTRLSFEGHLGGNAAHVVCSSKESQPAASVASSAEPISPMKASYVFCQGVVSSAEPMPQKRATMISLASTVDFDPSDSVGDAESTSEDDACPKAHEEDDWEMVVEGGSPTSGPAGGTGEGPAADNTDGFTIYDAPFARKPITDDVASDTGSAPTIYRSEASPQASPQLQSSVGTPRSSGGSEISPLDALPIQEASIPETPATEAARNTPPKVSVASFWQMDAVREKPSLADEPYSCRCGDGGCIVTHGEIISSNYKATTGPGYLTCAARNTIISDIKQEVVFLSGSYTVCDVECEKCRETLGVKYVGALQPANLHKVGQFLLAQGLLTPAHRSP